MSKSDGRIVLIIGGGGVRGGGGPPHRVCMMICLNCFQFHVELDNYEIPICSLFDGAVPSQADI